MFFYIATFCIWVYLLNLPYQQIKDIKTCSFTKNRLLQHGYKKELGQRLRHCRLYKIPEASLKADYHNIDIKTGSIIDSITLIYSRDLKVY